MTSPHVRSSEPFVLVLAPWPSGVGGIEQVTRDLLEALSSRYGRERVGLVQVWSGGSFTDLACSVLRWGPERESELSRISPWNKATFTVAALRAARQKRGHLIVISAHPFLAPVGRMCSVVSGGPHLVWSYGSESWVEPPKSVASALRRADHLVAISSFTSKRLQETIGIAPSKISVLHLPVPERISRLVASSSAAEGKTESGPASSATLLAVGRLDPSEREKGMDTVIRALPRIRAARPGTRFVIVGDGGDRGRLEDIARTSGVEENVEFAGAVDDDALARHYSDADVFVMPSAQEGFGLVFVEAMAFGTPVIGGDHGGTPDVITDGVTGFLVPFGDEEATADRVVQLLKDEGLRQRMSQAGLDEVRQRFSPEMFRTSLGQILDRVTSQATGVH